MRWGPRAAKREGAARNASRHEGRGEGEDCRREFATFREFYRSRDGRIIVFEDAEGHLTSVDSSRLA